MRAAPATAPPKPSQRVLVLYSDERLLPANIAIDEAIRATFAASTNNRSNSIASSLTAPAFRARRRNNTSVISFGINTASVLPTW